MPQHPPNPPQKPVPGSTARPTPPQGASGPTAARPTPPVAPPQGYVPPQGYGPAQVPGPGPGYGPARGQDRVPPTQALRAPTQGFTGSAPVTAAVAPPADPAKKRDLTVNKVIAGAGAAATSAVLGSFFGAAGTIGGAALGSIFSTVVTSLYEHSLDKTRDTVKARVKLPGGRTVDVAGTTEVPAPHVAAGGETGQARVYVTPGDRPTEVMSAVPATGGVDPGPPRSRRRLLVMAGFTVVVFALGLLAVTGIELLKGSPLNTGGTGNSGTSVGRVLTGGADTDSADDASSDTTESATATEDPDSEPTTPARSSAEPTAESGSGSGADDEEQAPATPRNSAPATPIPTPQSGGGAGSGGQAGGGAAESAGPVAAG